MEHVVLYFSGHGRQVRIGKTEKIENAWITYDSDTGKANKDIPQSAIKKWIQLVASTSVKHVTSIIDSCYSVDITEPFRSENCYQIKSCDGDVVEKLFVQECDLISDCNLPINMQWKEKFIAFNSCMPTEKSLQYCDPLLKVEYSLFSFCLFAEMIRMKTISFSEAISLVEKLYLDHVRIIVVTYTCRNENYLRC